MKTILWREGLELDPMDLADDVVIEIDWTDKIGESAIVSADASATTGVTVVVDSSTSDKVYLRFNSGTPGAFPVVSFSITTDRPETFNRSFTLPIDDL